MSHDEVQASLWAARLDGGSFGPEERESLDAWLRKAEGNRALLAQYCQFNADLEEQVPALLATGSIEFPNVESVRRRGAGLVMIGLSLAAAAAIVLAVRLTRPPPATETIATSVAQRRTFTLADGTRLELNARTNVLVHFTPSERRVRLADGEALFTVAPDSSRPFIVETPAGSIRDTGTVFDVDSDAASGLTVTVASGSVQVTLCQPHDGNRIGPVSLNAEDQLAASSGREVRRRLGRDELDNLLAWRRGEAVFPDTPLETALAEFARYHGVAITVSPRVAEMRVGGRFKLDNLQGFLSGIETMLPVRVLRESSGAIFVAPRTGG